MAHTDDEHVDTEWHDERARCAVCGARAVIRQRRFSVVPGARYLSARCEVDMHHDLTQTTHSLLAELRWAVAS